MYWDLSYIDWNLNMSEILNSPASEDWSQSIIREQLHLQLVSWHSFGEKVTGQLLFRKPAGQKQLKLKTLNDMKQESSDLSLLPFVLILKTTLSPIHCDQYIYF